MWALLCPAKVPALFPEAVSLRRFQLLLFFLELVYIFLELFFYSSFMLVLFEIPRCWMCFYNYMTLSRCMMNVFMVWIVVGAAGSIFNMFTIGLSGLVNLILFPAQLALMFLTGYLLWFKIGTYVAAKKEYEKGIKKGGPKAAEESGNLQAKINVDGVEVPVNVNTKDIKIKI